MINLKPLILDEPSIKLAPVFVDSVFESIHKINAGFTSTLMVEGDAAHAWRAPVADMCWIGKQSVRRKCEGHG